VRKDESCWHKEGDSPPVQVVVEEVEQAKHKGRKWAISRRTTDDLYMDQMRFITKPVVGSSGVRSIESEAVISKWGNNK